MSGGAGARQWPAEIERLRAGDGERLREIRLRALRDAPDAFETTLKEAVTWPPASWERQIEQLPTFVAALGGRDVGLVRGSPSEEACDTGYLISMWVEPDVRRRGIGSALIDAVVEWAGTRGLDRLVLDVAETNIAAIELYVSKGFVRSGEVGALPPPREHIREIELVMKL